MLPMRPMTPAQASTASLSVVLPDDAWPTKAKFRRSPAEGVAITQIRFYPKDASSWLRAQAEISGSLRGRGGRTSRQLRAEIRSTAVHHLDTIPTTKLLTYF
jgi:hypothetical protein